MIEFRRLKDLREDNDISQNDMAKILKVNRSTYSLWELGINIIPLDYLCSFADYFNVSIDYVLGLTNKKVKSINKGFNKKKLGSNMKDIRLKHNLSQENIADIISVSQVAIVKYEKGLVCISTNNLYKFCKEFNISMSDILGKTKK